MKNKLSRHLSLRLWLTSSILGSVIFSFAAVWLTSVQQQEAANDRVRQEADLLIERIYERINLYQFGLRGARGFVLAEELRGNLSREGFTNYSATRDYAREFPGARGFGFIRRVPLAREAEFLLQAKADAFPEFSLRQLTPHDGERYVIQYIEPIENNRAAVGLDIASELHRRRAAEQAINEGFMQITAPITLVQATGNPQQSFLILLPIYRSWATPENISDRWQQAIGWAYAPLLMTEILDSLKIDPELYHLRLSDVKDRDNQQVFYQINSGKQYGKTQLRRHEVFGRIWQLELGATPTLAAQLQVVKPASAFVYTFFVSQLIFALLYAVAKYWLTREQLFRQASRLAVIVESSNDAIIGQDLKGTILSWNKGAEDIFGFSAQEAVGQTAMNLLVPESKESEARRILEQVSQGKRESNLVTLRKRKNGEMFDALINLAPIYDDKQQIVGASKTLRDISALMRAEQDLKDLNANLEQEVEQRTAALSHSLRENEAILKVINAQFLFSITDHRGDILQVNENFCRACGYSAEELTGKNHRILNSRFHPRKFWTGMWETVLSGNSWRGEVCNLSRDGEPRWFDSVIAPILNEQGKVERILAVRIEVSERKRMELELAAARDQLNKAAEVAKLGIWVWNVRDNSLQWNARMFDIYAQDPHINNNGLDYSHWRDRLYAPDRERVENLLQCALQGEAQFDTTFRIQLPNGEVRYIKASSLIERDRHGQPERVTGINFDISDQYQLEQELRRARDLADEASASKSQFLANMSHEIRTPMNGVLGMLELVKRTPLDRQQKTYINNADRAARSLLGILNDILDYSKISAGKLELDPVQFSLEAMLRELGVILAGNHAAKQVEVIFDKDRNLPDKVIGDNLRIMQILINLAGNALKFTEKGSVLVQFTLLKKDADTLAMRVLIEDTGIGMSKEQQARLFQVFSQAESSTTRRFGGTGLGLVICKHLLELMGSQLVIESQPNVGSRFWFNLNLNYVADEVSVAKSEILEKTQKVLVVDDCPLVAEVLCEGLHAAGWQAQTANSAAAALNAIALAEKEKTPFDVVLMDWNMPGMNGLEASKIIRQNEQAALIPHIIMITAYEKEVIDKITANEQKPFDEILVKPVTISQVENVISDCLNRSGNGEKPETESEVANEFPLEGIRILLVEDNELNQYLACELLMAEGAKVTVASGGLYALNMVLSEPDAFDLVLMDIQMPDIDGYEATRRIRAEQATHPALATLPIIAMTANASESDRQQCLEAGMNDHVPKPFDTDVLIAIIRKYCREETGPSLEASSADENLAEENRFLSIPLTESSERLLARFRNNHELAARMRDRFELEATTLYKKIALSKAEGSLSAQILHIHSLKGVSATLGATRLAAFLAGLEEKTRKGLPLSEAALMQLNDLVAQSVSGLQSLQFTVCAVPAAREVQNDELTELFKKMEVCLRDNNMNAIKLAEQIHASIPDDDLVKTLYEQVDNLDFKTAKQTLIAVKNKFMVRQVNP